MLPLLTAVLRGCMELGSGEVVHTTLAVERGCVSPVCIHCRGLTVGRRYELKLSRPSTAPLAFRVVGELECTTTDEKVVFVSPSEALVVELEVVGAGVGEVAYSADLYVSLDELHLGLAQNILSVIAALVCSLPLILLLARRIASWLEQER